MTGVNYILANKVKKALDAGVIKGNYRQFNEPSISELAQRIKAMDEIDIFVVINTIVDHHRETLVNTLEYMDKEGDRP